MQTAASRLHWHLASHRNISQSPPPSDKTICKSHPALANLAHTSLHYNYLCHAQFNLQHNRIPRPYQHRLIQRLHIQCTRRRRWWQQLSTNSKTQRYHTTGKTFYDSWTRLTCLNNSYHLTAGSHCHCRSSCCCHHCHHRHYFYCHDKGRNGIRLVAMMHCNDGLIDDAYFCTISNLLNFV